MRFALILAALRLSAQIHVNSCTPTDTGFTGGTCYTSPIPLPAGAPSYLQQERYGNFSYRFPMADGQYAVTLHFIENSTAITGPGQRQFSVSINGGPVLTAFDLAATVALNTPIDRFFPVLAGGGAGLTIVFTTIVRNAVVSAIDITPVVPPSDPFPGCVSDGAGGIGCTGEIRTGTGGSFVGFIEVAGMAATTAPLVIYFFPPSSTVDTTGMVLRDAGVISCPALDPRVVARAPVCHQLAWKP